MGKGTPETHKYSYNVKYHSGLNKYRVKQTDQSNKPRYSKETTFRSLEAPITFSPGNAGRASEWILFSAVTDYEIYDYYGKLQKKGNSDKIDVATLKKGTYFLNYDNKTETFIKR